MTSKGADFLTKVQSVIWNSFSSMLELKHQRDNIDEHRADLQATLDAIGSTDIPQHMLESLEHARLKVAGNERSIEIYDIAINIAAGSILQIARQAISMQHEGRAQCPEGRLVSGRNVRDLIWHGRNQSMHYEEELTGSRSFIERLEEEFPFQFPRRVPAASHAKAILDLMEWTTNPSLIEEDMRELMQRSEPAISSS